MKPTPYLKQVLKDLDRDLKKFPRGKRAEVLAAYRTGLEMSFHDCYPGRFADLNSQELTRDYSYLIHRVIFRKGYSVGAQFGELEVDFARQLLLEEVEKRKTKYSKPGLIGRLLGGRNDTSTG